MKRKTVSEFSTDSSSSNNELRAGLDTETRGKIHCLRGGPNPVVQCVVRHYTDLSYPDFITWRVVANIMNKQSVTANKG
jgi:hypothetical protein